MRVRVLPALLLLALSAAFAFINWDAFTAPTTLNLGFTTVVAPLGMVMLGVVVLLGAMYIASVVYVQGAALIDARRMNRQFIALRDQLDRAENSRFTELRDFMSAELLRVTQASDQLRSTLLGRLEHLEQRQRSAMEDAANSLSAYIGQMEDRLEHRLAGDAPVQREDFRAGPKNN